MDYSPENYYLDEQLEWKKTIDGLLGSEQQFDSEQGKNVDWGLSNVSLGYIYVAIFLLFILTMVELVIRTTHFMYVRSVLLHGATPLLFVYITLVALLALIYQLS